MPQTTKSSVRPAQSGRRWLTRIDAAEYLGVTTRTIEKYNALGILPAHRIKGTRQIRIDRAELEALLIKIPDASA